MSPGATGQRDAAVILLNLGGPDSPEAVRPYIKNLFADPEMIRLPLGPRGRAAFASFVALMRAPSSRKKYGLIGGSSPLARITSEQAVALAGELSGRGLDASVHVGMRYWRPTIDEALDEAISAGARQVVALPLYPQFSVVTSGSSFRELTRARDAHDEEVELIEVREYHDHDGYVDAVVETVNAALDRLPADRRDGAAVLFSAHSIPQRTADAGDPYPAQVRRTAQRVGEGLGGTRWELGFQSRVGPVKWVGPESTDVLERLGAEGCTAVVIAPLGFVSDHLETLYDMDVLLRDKARKLGIDTFVRADSLNTRPAFVGALAELVLSAMGHGEEAVR